MKASVGFLEKLTKQKRLTEKEKTQLTEIRNESGYITTNSAEIKRIMRPL